MTTMIPPTTPPQESHQEESEDEEIHDAASTTQPRRHTVRASTAPVASMSQPTSTTRFASTAATSTGNPSRPFARRASTGRVPRRGGGGASLSTSGGGALSVARGRTIGGGERFLAIDQHGREVQVAEINSTMTPGIVAEMLRRALAAGVFAQVAGLLLHDINPKLVGRVYTRLACCVFLRGVV